MGLIETLSNFLGLHNSCHEKFQTENAFQKQEIDKLRSEKNDLQLKFANALNSEKQLEVCLSERKYFQLKNSDCLADKQVLLTKLEDYKTKTNIDLVNPFNVPLANISYQRPVLIGKDKWSTSLIDVRLFITPKDYVIQNEIKQAGLFYDGKNLDELVPKIYQLAKKDYKYQFDNQFGFGEFWLFPFENRECRKQGIALDCDDWAIKIVSYLECAGVPSDRILVSAGYTRSNEGHATVYVKDSNNVWRHLNSTTPHYSYSDLKLFPSNKEETDMLGIHSDKFWFSFNSKYAIHKFETSSTAEGFNKDKLSSKVLIESVNV